jgi:hypothetical protein
MEPDFFSRIFSFALCRRYEREEDDDVARFRLSSANNNRQQAHRKSSHSRHTLVKSGWHTEHFSHLPFTIES